MAKSGKAVYSKLNHIYIWFGRASKMYFSILCTLLLYIPEIINKNKIFLARVLLAIFSILFFVFILIERVRCCAILTIGIRAND